MVISPLGGSAGRSVRSTGSEITSSPEVGGHRQAFCPRYSNISREFVQNPLCRIRTLLCPCRGVGLSLRRRTPPRWTARRRPPCFSSPAPAYGRQRRAGSSSVRNRERSDSGAPSAPSLEGADD
uniref:Uncharacterized protein n=1 Tax=Nonomuraea gerenzanensis TaxID=93944 RepID=A0A1M4EEB6_9ACTN|nr:hypothetical protein BN4615_P6771 [Nonomuraea gerenzanensis]